MNSTVTGYAHTLPQCLTKITTLVRTQQYVKLLYSILMALIIKAAIQIPAEDAHDAGWRELH